MQLVHVASRKCQGGGGDRDRERRGTDPYKTIRKTYGEKWRSK
jgi:hypothetical protein